MIGQNHQIIGNKKIQGKPGGQANETRFFDVEHHKRERKITICPSVNTNASLKFEQAWNKASVMEDVVKITFGDQHVIIERADLEQAIFAMAQGMELIKYAPPKF